VGSGNAALCAAIAAADSGADVVVLEKAPRDWAGGNSFFTAGGFRVAHAGLPDLLQLLNPATLPDLEIILAPYTRDDYVADVLRVTEHRADRALLDRLVDDSHDTLAWLHDVGLEFRLMIERQAFRIANTLRFWGDLAIGTVDGGKGLVRGLTSLAEARNVAFAFDSPMTDLDLDHSRRICGVRFRLNGGAEKVIKSRAVVLACGGFESDPALRAQFLGAPWDLAKVRGTPFNTGDGHRIAINRGAAPAGHWSGCHAVAWDAGAPDYGSREHTNTYTRGSYPAGIVVNERAERFVDEGADFRVYTYAKYGAAILFQPGSHAFQLFDAQAAPYLRTDEYTSIATQMHAETVDDLARQIGVDASALRRTIATFNRAVEPGEFDLTQLDGKSARGVVPAKSNWAQTLDKPPFSAYPVTCGITFTFGGLRINDDAAVLDRCGRIIEGLFAAGELSGGLFYHNYPGGAGLMAGAVFGRRAGLNAAGGAVRGS